MAERATITVRRQILDVEVLGRAEDGLALQRRLPATCEQLAPVLEAELGRYDPGDAHLYVERLSLDLHAIAIDHLDDELAEAIHRALTEFFHHHPPCYSKHSDAEEERGASATAGPVRLRSDAATVEDAFIQFLGSGQIPWSFRPAPGTRLEELLVGSWDRTKAEAGNRLPAPTSTRLARAMSSAIARKRLFLQFPHSFVHELLRRWSPSSLAALDEVCGVDFGQAGVPLAAQREFTDAAWDAAVAAAAAGARCTGADLAHHAWQHMAPASNDHHRLHAVLVTRWPTVFTGTSRGGQHPVPPAEAAPRTQTRSSAPVRPEDFPATESLLVDNAGVVLLHPFLPRLFERLGVADGDQLLDPQRGIRLLHHLATGTPTAPEHQLTVAKVLCDLPLAEPVPADLGLTMDEPAEAEALLEAVISHWGALGGTAPDCLRGEFLMRPGILDPDVSGAWLLRVETRTSDILLDRLPWSISMIKLPWMRRLMRTEWR